MDACKANAWRTAKRGQSSICLASTAAGDSHLQIADVPMSNDPVTTETPRSHAMTHPAHALGAVASMLASTLMLAAAPAPQESVPPGLVDIDGSSDAFIEQFNDGEGRTRFVAVLSPT